MGVDGGFSCCFFDEWDDVDFFECVVEEESSFLCPLGVVVYGFCSVWVCYLDGS